MASCSFMGPHGPSTRTMAGTIRKAEGAINSAFTHAAYVGEADDSSLVASTKHAF